MSNITVPIMNSPPPYEAVPNRTSKAYDGRLKIIVGLDFGTTNSGLSYVTSDQDSADKIEVIRQWPNGPGTVGKVPSIIAYKNDNPDEGLDSDQWGFSASGLKAYMWTKLLLGKDSRSEQTQSSRLREIYGNGFCTLPPGKTAKHVVADYLRGLYQCLTDRLTRHDENMYRLTPMECWITVPAMWSDVAKNATIEAAKIAGFGSRHMDSINVITEPEAAALSVLMPRVGLGSITGLSNGSRNILICDCGGGTVDIVTYRVTQQNGPIEFEELLVGTGAMCGSTAIDRAFNDWMVKKFGEAYTKIDMEMRGPASNFFRQFEIAKKNYTGPTYTKRLDIWPINMDIPRSASYDKRNFTVRMQANEMQELFDPTLDEIVGLVDSQCEAAKAKGEKIDQLFLVGGFGDSPYLNAKLKDWCSSQSIVLKSPPSCQEAIVKGAALRGLERLRPSKRLARRHYGYSISMLFREGIDNEDYAWNSEFDGKKWSNHRMSYFCRKGDSIDDYKKQTFDCWRTFYETSTDLTSTIHVWHCDQDDRPDTSKHWSMQKMGKVTVHFTESEVKSSEKKVVNGRTMYKVPYDIEVDFFSERGDIQFKTIMNGKVKGNATIQFEQSNDMAYE